MQVKIGRYNLATKGEPGEDKRYWMLIENWGQEEIGDGALEAAFLSTDPDSFGERIRYDLTEDIKDIEGSLSGKTKISGVPANGFAIVQGTVRLPAYHTTANVYPVLLQEGKIVYRYGGFPLTTDPTQEGILFSDFRFGSSQYNNVWDGSDAPVPNLSIQGGTPPVQDNRQVLVIDCGGNGDVGFSGNTDTHGFEEDVEGLEDEADADLFRTCRYAREGGAVRYNISVPPGTYRLELLFAEPHYTTRGRRKFHVAVDGAMAAENFDIVKATGGKFKATTLYVPVMTGSGQIKIDLLPVTGDPLISGIKVVPAESANIGA